MTDKPVPKTTGSELNILLICIDDLRADRLSFMGNSRQTCPNLSRRLSEATLFHNCQSPVGWTLPGCASLITGLNPDDHGLVHHGHRFRAPKLGHYLGAVYHRVAMTNNGNLVPDHIEQRVLDGLGLERRPEKWRRFGWNHGFDDYRWWSREHERAPFEQATTFVHAATREDSAPWLLFLHANIVHDYHLARDCYLDAPWAGDAVHPDLRQLDDGPDPWRALPAGITPEAAADQLLRKYDAGILAMDLLLETVLAAVDFESTLVVFTSDHGEGFEPELGRVHHCGRLHDDLTHVPLLLWLPRKLKERLQPPAEEQRVCSTIDVVPTLLQLTGRQQRQLPGHFLFDLPTHREVNGSDRGYLFWDRDLVRESYDQCDIEIRSQLRYPLKRIQVRRDQESREYEYQLACDPGERHNLLEPTENILEPVTFVVVVNDYEELRWNLLASPLTQDDRHQWLLLDNRNNGADRGIAQLYADACERACNDLVFFLHQDVYLPRGWDAQVARALEMLEARDPCWGVIGAAGMGPDTDGQAQIFGHWSDPHGYHRQGPLPQPVRTLDELWLGLRKHRGPHFDPNLPGYHCYGADLCLSAERKGMTSYALDAFLWHKFRDREGKLIARAEQCAKLRTRWSDEFMAAFQPCADYLDRKWHHAKPFRTTTWCW